MEINIRFLRVDMYKFVVFFCSYVENILLIFKYIRNMKIYVVILFWFKVFIRVFILWEV